MRHSRVPAGALLAAVLVASSAQATQPVAAVSALPPLEGTAWVLSELPGQRLQAGRSATLRFTGGRALGFDGCNAFREQYAIVAGVLEIAEPISSLMECPPERLQQVGGFRSAIGGARSYRIDGTVLRLLTADGSLLAALAAQPATLAGTSWRATAINNGKQAVASVVPDSSVTLEFADDGTASGSAGCSRYTAAYRHDGAMLSFQPPVVTRKKCKRPQLLAQEESFLKALQSSASARFDGDRLELRTVDGALAVQLTRAGKRSETARAPGICPRRSRTTECSRIGGTMTLRDTTDLDSGSSSRHRSRGLALVAFAVASAALASGLFTASAQDKARYLDAALPLDERVEDLLGRLTLEEKVALVHANGKFRAGGVERLGIPYLWTADGPQGVREEVGVDSWEPAGWTSDFATAMPVGIALASSWDPQLAEAYGRTVGEEARARGKHVILGPALNIQRTPLCGRNYDYFGEDPWLAGRITVGYVRGMQAEQTIACIKHYALNNQEQQRGSIDVQVEERPLREIYLPAFEAGVREGGALAVMGAYNKVRGEHACHNDYLLNQVLKREWGFKGAVISDWGGTHDTPEAVLKGLDLEMGTGRPYDQYFLASAFLAGLKDGTYPVSALDDKVRRNLRMLIAAGGLDGRRPGTINTKGHLEVARRVAQEGIVLLKNDAAVLPLDVATLKTIAVIGDNAVRRFAAGGNAAGVKAFHEVTALDGIVARVGGRADVVFSQGYRQPQPRRGGPRDVAGVRTSELTASSPAEAKELADRAVDTARRADAVVFVGGLTHQAFADDEGVDRRDLSLSAHQDELIARVVEANPRTAVVLIAGSPIEMSAWLAKTKAVLQAWYGGSEAGNALAAVLFGDVSPSGKLPCTFPKALVDSPAHAAGLARQFPGENGKVYYDEGLLVGYRWNDAKGVEPAFPFGHGLSYTTFRYAELKPTLTVTAGGPSVSLELSVTNSGTREGAEVVQAYVRPLKPPVARPEKELKGFAKLALKPGETKTATIALGPRAFAYYDPEAKGWRVAKGRYELLVGASSSDIRLRDGVDVARPALVR